MAFLRPDGPAAAVAAWVEAVVDHADLGTAWELTDQPLRLSRVQSWILAEDIAVTDDRDVLAHGMSALGASHPAWPEFAAWCIGRWHSYTFNGLMAGWGIVTTAEVAGLDLEFVRIAPTVESRPIEAGERVVVNTFTTRLVRGRWLVSGIGRALPVPGWPPMEQELPSDS